MSRVELKLDATAMRALFPDLSKASLELQRCVVAEVVRKLPKLPNLEQEILQIVSASKIDSVVSDQANKHLLSAYLKNGLNEKIQLKLEDAVNKFLTYNVNAVINKQIEESTKLAFKSLDAKIVDLVDKKFATIENELKFSVNALVSDKINKIVEQLS